MDFKISFESGHFDVKLSGKSNIEDCRHYFDQLVSHDHWKPGSLVLSDETEVEVGHLSANEIHAMAYTCENMKDAFGTARFAAYVESDLGYGMNRMFQAHAQIKWDAVVEVFRNRSNALEWLYSNS